MVRSVVARTPATSLRLKPFSNSSATWRFNRLNALARLLQAGPEDGYGLVTPAARSLLLSSPTALMSLSSKEAVQTTGGRS